MKLKDIAVGQTVFVKAYGSGSRHSLAWRERWIGTVMAVGWRKSPGLWRGIALPDGSTYRHPPQAISGGNLVLVRLDRHVHEFSKVGEGFEPVNVPRYELLSAGTLVEWSEQAESDYLQERDRSIREAEARATAAKEQKLAERSEAEAAIATLRETYGFPVFGSGLVVHIKATELLALVEKAVRRV